MRRWLSLMGMVLGAVSCGGVVVVDGSPIDPDDGAGGIFNGQTTGAHTSGGGGFNPGTSSAHGGSVSVAASAASGGFPDKAMCASYCADIMANCTGNNAQYPDKVSCEAICATFPLGTPGPNAPQGDSLLCRAYHAGAPSKAAPATHCHHAGLTGGDLNPTKSGGPVEDGPCGDGAEAFCKAAVKTCPTIWSTVPACLSEATNFKPDQVPYSQTDVDKNDFGCHVSHLTLAARSNDFAMVHCPHITLGSFVCVK